MVRFCLTQEGRFAQLTTTHKALTAQYEALKTELADTKAAAEVQSDDLKQRSKTLSDTLAKLEQTETDLRDARAAKDTLEEQSKKLEGQIGIEQQCGLKLTSLLAAAENENKAYKLNIDTLATANTTHADQIQALNMRVEELTATKASLAQTQAECQRLSDAHAALTQANEDLTAAVATLTATEQTLVLFGLKWNLCSLAGVKRKRILVLAV